MARHEGDFRPGAKQPLTLNDLLELLGAGGEAAERTRQDAIACYLSAGEGWREALKQLGGAFAEDGTELRDRKSD